MLIKVWGVIIIVFLLGAVTGGAVSGLFHTQGSAAGEAISLRSGDAYFDTLKQELNLTSEQESVMRNVIEEARAQYKSVCSEVRPRYDTVRDNARSRMRVLLSPDQQQRFDLIVTREDCRCPEPRGK
jgi:hypothetical protein